MVSQIARFVRARILQRHEGEALVDYSLIFASLLLAAVAGLFALNPQIRAILFEVKPG